MRSTVCLLVLAAVAGHAGSTFAGEPEFLHVTLGGGYVSPLADPDLSEGYGVGAAFWANMIGRFGAKLAIDIAHNDLEGDLGEVPWPYANGDITFGATFEITRPGSAFGWLLGVETGPYWTAYLLGTSWTWGVGFGTALAWRFSRLLGVQAETRYHLYNLGGIGGLPILSPATMRPAPVLDRLDVFFSVVVAL